jgi:HSP20 family protein
MANLVRFNDPFTGLTSLHSQLDDIFNTLLSPSLSLPGRGVPAMDVYTEDGKQLVGEIQAPGFKPEDIEVSVNNGVLEIKGEIHEKVEPADNAKDTGRKYMMRESHSSFYRSVVLPKHADTESIQAEFENGVLKVVVPFKELPQPKKIAITGGKKK